jgi:hypothetical protein
MKNTMRSLKRQQTKLHPRRLVNVPMATVKGDLKFWLPIVLRAQAEGRIKADSTSLELSLLLV